MPGVVSPLAQIMKQHLPAPNRTTINGLLKYYSFEADGAAMEGQSSGQTLNNWLRTFPSEWVQLALIESLYQGRYKSISVEQILRLWQRRGHPVYHFTYEFESLICRQVPRPLSQKNHPVHRVSAAPAAQSAAALKPNAPSVQPPSQDSVSHTGAEVGSAPSHPAKQDTSSVSATPALDNPTDAAVEVASDPWLESASPAEQGIASAPEKPLTLNPTGLEPIHQFMPDGKPPAFCEKLDAIADQQSQST